MTPISRWPRLNYLQANFLKARLRIAAFYAFFFSFGFINNASTFAGPDEELKREEKTEATENARNSKRPPVAPEEWRDVKFNDTPYKRNELNLANFVTELLLVADPSERTRGARVLFDPERIFPHQWRFFTRINEKGKVIGNFFEAEDSKKRDLLDFGLRESDPRAEITVLRGDGLKNFNRFFERTLAKVRGRANSFNKVLNEIRKIDDLRKAGSARFELSPRPGAMSSLEEEQKRRALTEAKKRQVSERDWAEPDLRSSALSSVERQMQLLLEEGGQRFDLLSASSDKIEFEELRVELSKQLKMLVAEVEFEKLKKTIRYAQALNDQEKEHFRLIGREFFESKNAYRLKVTGRNVEIRPGLENDIHLGPSGEIYYTNYELN